MTDDGPGLMSDRRRFLQCASLAALAVAVQPAGVAAGQRRLPRRPIPGTGDSLPIVGLGNSNAFREGDLERSTRIIQTLLDYGGAYVDCAGPSRMVVAQVVGRLAAGGECFLGTYFPSGDETESLADAERILELAGRQTLDLMHGYPEHAVPRWDDFRRWKDTGLTRYIGVARHQPRYYDAMMGLLETDTVDFLQVNYSLLETEAEQRILPMAMDRGVAVAINRPFINGDYFRIVRGHPLPEWAADFDCASWAQFSLKFILSHPAVTCVLTETANPAHARDNLEAGFGRLPEPAMRRRMLQYIRAL